MGRPYNALNGEELKEAILKKIRTELELDTRFRSGTTYPVIKYGFRLRIEAYPQEPATSEIQINDTITEPGEVENALSTPEVVSVESIEKVEDPDQAREAAGVPVPVPTKLPSGEIVDVTHAQKRVIPAPSGLPQRTRPFKDAQLKKD